MTSTKHRLDGLEPDNLLAFLALLGVLRSLEADARVEGGRGEELHPRISWDVDQSPLRPALVLARPASRDKILAAAARGIDLLSQAHEFDGEMTLNYTAEHSREILAQATEPATVEARDRVDLLAALMSDGAVKDAKSNAVQPTPLCLQFGQGRQYFLDRLAAVPRVPAPPPRGRGRSKRTITAEECLAEALFHPWHRADATFSFRWDPEEDVRYALMAGDPTDAAYKTGTQHGANRLAAVGLAALTVAPSGGLGRSSLTVLGGEHRRGFTFAWPVWRDPASLAAIRALLGHPGLREPGALDHLGVEHVFVARRISVGKFMNFSRARPLIREP